ncbi:MAG: tetratricopeptide repeat protein [Ignavibacteriaceae bacterium]|nr:tetratricopeptide repeat protein [Ignavibacteriaceae bacterium]
MVNKKQSVTVKETGIYFYLFLLVILPLVLNWKIIGYDFTTSDDTTIISNNYAFLTNPKNVFKAFEMDNFLSKDGKNYYRPVQTVSFMLDAQISTEKPNVFHFLNILYHILTVIILFFLFRKLGIKDNIAFFISLLFSIHPIFTDAIAWLPGRGDLLAGLFCSVAFLTFLYYETTKNVWYFVFHSIAFALALFSKETSVFLPLAMVFYYIVVLKNKYKIRGLVPFIFPWSITVFLFFLLRHLFLNYQNVLSITAFITNLRVIPTFLGELFIPLGLSPMPVYNILLIIIGLLVISSSSVYLWKIRIGNKTLIMLGILWFLGFIIPTLFVVLTFAKARFDYLECRFYLPSIGIFIALAVLLNEIIKGKGISILLKFFIPVILIFSLVSYFYSGNFADANSFYSSIIKSNPVNAYALNVRGCIYMNQKKYDLALADFDSSIKCVSTYNEPLFNKAVLYGSINDHIRAEQFYSVALKYDTLYPGETGLGAQVYLNLSSEEWALKKSNQAKTVLIKALTKYGDNAGLHYSLGQAYYYSSDFDSAFTEFNAAINLDQNFSTYYNSRGLAEYHLNDLSGALKDFNRALELKPDFLDAWGDRGMVKIKLNDYEGAIVDFTNAISIKHDLGAAWYFRGVAYSKLNKLAEAKENLNKSIEFGYKGKELDE